MNLKQNYLTQSGCYKAGKHITVQGLMIHSVGCPQPKADVFMKNWNRADANACVHAIIEPGGDVYQLLPWDYRGWHCGGGANNTHIGVEMTEPATIRYMGGASWAETGDGENTKAHVLATYKYAVELFAHLCQQFHLDPLADGVVISHSEGCKRGIASNHGDVEHLWSKFGLSMEQFRKDIKAAMEGGKTGLSFDTPQLGIRAQVQHLKAYASTDALINEKIDPRFRYVTRGCAPYVEWLGQKENPQGKGWAAGEKYGEKILSILKAVIDEGKVQFMESMQYGDVKPATEADVSGKLENLRRLMEQPPVPEDGEFSEEDIDKYVFGVRVYEDRFEWLLNLSPEARGELDDAGSPFIVSQ